MKKILLFTLFFYLLGVSALYAQVTYNSWNINSISPGGSISFSPGVIKSLSIAANLQKPNNQVVGDSYVYLSIKNSGGSEIAREQAQYIPGSFWSPGSGSNPVYYNFSVSVNALIPSVGAYKGYLVFVTYFKQYHFLFRYIFLYRFR